jgi:AraC family transcriptional regulator
LLSDNQSMQRRAAEPGGDTVEAVLTGACRVSREWRGLRAEYAWLPPFRGASITKPNRIEVVFSAHEDVVIEQEAVTYDVRVPPGGMYIVGERPTTLLHVAAYSDTLEMYPDPAILRDVARDRGAQSFELEPTLSGQRSPTFARDPAVLGIAHVLRRACMNRRTISDVEATVLAHVLAQRLVTLQHGGPRRAPAPRRLSRGTMDAVADVIEGGLARRLTLEELATVAGLSPFHFARCFKATTGLAPHQYVLARRIELAKRLLMTTKKPVHEVAWSIGFENISHFRRQFAAQVGVVPGVLRRATARCGGDRP